MEQLPAELYYKIFSLLDYRHLASVALVCRSWNYFSRQTDLWQQLYTQRWGGQQAECLILKQQKSWKAAYETRDRCDRVGLGITVCREGLDYLLVNKGEILCFLGSRNKESCQGESTSQGLPSSDEGVLKYTMQSDIFHSDENLGIQDADGSCSHLNADLLVGDSVESGSPCAGLIDKLIFFVGDLEGAMREQKRIHMF
eukprot:c26323_g1_i2 orf=683-1279(+)